MRYASDVSRIFPQHFKQYSSLQLCQFNHNIKRLIQDLGIVLRPYECQMSSGLHETVKDLYLYDQSLSEENTFKTQSFFSAPNLLHDLMIISERVLNHTN